MGCESTMVRRCINPTASSCRDIPIEAQHRARHPIQTNPQHLEQERSKNNPDTTSYHYPRSRDTPRAILSPPSSSRPIRPRDPVPAARSQTCPRSDPLDLQALTPHAPARPCTICDRAGGRAARVASHHQRSIVSNAISSHSSVSHAYHLTSSTAIRAQRGE